MVPAPQPLEGTTSGPMANYHPAGTEAGPRMNTISLAMLIDFIVQRTYHELTVMAELLPRKSDMERKKEIFMFAANARQLFIRLIALVKWANSVSKVDKSANIMSFLDKQNHLFVETADMLARMSRETLVRACLPNFHIPAAVEVLTTGTYNRVPACIRQRILPLPPITVSEKRQTLLRLNQIIQHRLVMGNLLPQMRDFKIHNGRVTFEVKNEFIISLTVVTDVLNVPWRVLEIEFVVEDKESTDGKQLVHPMQTNFVHNLVQSRLHLNPDGLDDVYNVLHYFSQALQIEVLYTQTLRLCYDRLEDNVAVEEYVPGYKLTVTYWRELTRRENKGELKFCLTVMAVPYEIGRPLSVLHVPSLGVRESGEVTERAMRPEYLSMERLIVHSVYIRSVSRLGTLKTELSSILKDIDMNLQGTPAVLTVPVLTPCLRAEQIHISIDTHTGLMRCHVPKHLDCPIVSELEETLNSDHKRIVELFSQLRFWITHRRCEKTLQHLPATATEHLNFLDEPTEPLMKPSMRTIYVKLHRHPNVILVVEFNEKPNTVNEMEYIFHLAYVEYHNEARDCSSAEATGTSITQPTPSSSQAAATGPDIPKLFTRLQRIVKFDTFVATHGPGTDVDELPPHKRKLNGEPLGPPAKQQKTIYPAYFIPELAHVVATCDEKIPFLGLAQEFTRQHIAHGGVQVEANATSLVLRLLSLPMPARPNSQAGAIDAKGQSQSHLHSHSLVQTQQGQALVHTQSQAAHGQAHGPGQGPIMGQLGQGMGQLQGMGHGQAFVQSLPLPEIRPDVWSDLQKRILSISIRSQMNKNNQVRVWVVEIVFYSTPLPSMHHKEQGNRRTVFLNYEQLTHDFQRTVDDFLRDWAKIVYLYTLVYDFAEVYKCQRAPFADMINIKSYNYLNLLMSYGPKKVVTCNVCWSSNGPMAGYRLTFVGGISAVNAHSVMKEILAVHLNRMHQLGSLVTLLHETYLPLSSIAKLPVLPHLGLPVPPLQRAQVPVLSFCIIPQSPSVVRLVYQNIYCIELRFRANRFVSLRDGAYSRFDRNRIDDYTPIQGLKAFLLKYVDDTAVYRGRAQGEEDNPPSPVAVEEAYGGPGSVTGAGSGAAPGGSSPFLSAGMRGPQSPRDSGLRFPAPHTPPSSSNPHTPASPHPSAGTGATSGPTHPNFNLTSPPAPHLPHPSPGGLMPSSPLNPQPSPHMVHSPGPNTLYMQGHQDSPFTAMSPANTNWPGSPSMPRPSPRPGQSPDHKSNQASGSAMSGNSVAGPVGLPRGPNARAWPGAMPTLLTHDAFDTLCRPNGHPNKELNVPDISPLERFLGCVYMRRQLYRHVQNEETLTLLNTTEPGVVLFKVDGLQCQVILNQMHMQSLHLKITQLPPLPTPDGKPPFQLNPDDLMVIEQYFDTRVAIPPFRPNMLNGFCRVLSCAPQVIKDFVQLMRMEMKPDLSGDQYKWTVQLCMRVPPSAAPIVPIGSPGVLICRLKILFFLQITRIPYNGKDWKDSPSLVLPMVYDIGSNITQLAERREQVHSQATNAASTLLRRFAEFGVQHGVCSLFPAVRDLMTNLQLPNDVPPPPPPPNQGMNIGPPPQAMGPVVGNSPNPMMHSPMQQLGQVGPPQVQAGYPQMGQPQGPQ